MTGIRLLTISQRRMSFPAATAMHASYVLKFT